MYENSTYEILGKTGLQLNMVPKHADTLSNWIAQYIPTHSTIGVFPNITVDEYLLSNQSPSYTNSSVLIPWTLRGSFGLYVYVPDTQLTLNLTKEDLNKYEGPDTYNITISDLSGYAIHTKRIDDDTVVDESYTNIPQTVVITTPLPHPGIYYINFDNNLTHGTRLITYDSTIKNISLNAGLVVSDTKGIQFGENASFYTATNFPGFEITDRDGHTLQINSSANILPTEHLSITQLSESMTQMDVTAGARLRGLTVSPSLETYFRPLRYTFTQINPDYWVIPSQDLITREYLGEFAKKGTVGMGIRHTSANGISHTIEGIQKIELQIIKKSTFDF
jgi:hypothetical protein